MMTIDFSENIPNSEKYEKVGELIRISRKESGVTIEEIMLKTKLKKNYILDIEAGNFAKVNGQIYYYGYVTKLCNFLNIDTIAIAKYLDFYNEADIHEKKIYKTANQENKDQISSLNDEYLIENIKNFHSNNKTKQSFSYIKIFGIIITIIITFTAIKTLQYFGFIVL